jgi:hypothetical protein
MLRAAGHSHMIDGAAGFGPHQLAQAAVTASGFVLDAKEVAVTAKRVFDDNIIQDSSLVSFDWQIFLEDNPAFDHVCEYEARCERTYSCGIAPCLRIF